MKSLLAPILLALLFTVGLGQQTRNCDVQNAYGCLRLQGGSGWFQFCPASAASSTDSSDGSSPSCVNIRPFRFEERDAAGNRIAGHSVNNFPALTLGTPSIGSLALTCIDANNFICGTPSDGSLTMDYMKVTAYTLLPGGYLYIHFYLFNNSGTVNFGTQSLQVTKGTAKFNIEFSSYSFCGGSGGSTGSCGNSVGKSVAFQLTVKTQSQGSSMSTRGNVSSAQGISSFNYFLSRNNSFGSAVWNTATPTLTTNGANQVIQYEFSGPFTSMVYDPVVYIGSSSSFATAACIMSLLVAVLMSLF